MSNDGNGETKAFRLPSLCSPRTRKLTFVIAQRFEVAGALSTSEPGHVEWKLSKEIWDTFAHYPQGSSIHTVLGLHSEPRKKCPHAGEVRSTNRKWDLQSTARICREKSSSATQVVTTPARAGTSRTRTKKVDIKSKLKLIELRSPRIL